MIKDTHGEKERHPTGYNSGMYRIAMSGIIRLRKNRRNDPSRMELKKYCPRCKEHIMHREVK